MKKRILLLYPAKLDQQGKPIKMKRPILRSLTLPYIAALTPDIDKYDIAIYHDSYDDIPFNEKWDLVGISMMSTQAPRGYDIARIFRSKGVPVVFGGFHATLAPEEVSEHGDAIVIGEGEETWPRLIIDLFERDRLEKIYKEEKLHSLTNLPTPRFDLLKSNETYLDRSYPVQTTRGCPYNCNYCEVTRVYGSSYRRRPLNEVFRDIESTGSNQVYFVDDNIAAHREHSRELFSMLRETDCRWAGLATLNFVDNDELFSLALESGCYHLNFGMESISPVSLKFVDKKQNDADKYRDQFNRLNRSGLWYSVNVMFGLDGDTEEKCVETVRFLIDNQVPMSFMFILAPRVGTKIREILAGEGRILHDRWERYTGAETTFIPKHFRPEELDRILWQSMKDFYSPVSIFRRIVKPGKNNFWKLLMYNLFFLKASRNRLHPVLMF